MKNKELMKRDKPCSEFPQLCDRINRAHNPDPKDIDRLRKVVAKTPGFLEACSTSEFVRRQLIEKVGQGASQSFMLAELDLLKKQFNYDTAPLLERLLIDHILTVRLRLVHAETLYNNRVVNESVTFKSAEYWDNLLSSTQARFLRAIEALARVRRLARKAPPLQINIAREGGQQVNIQ